MRILKLQDQSGLIELNSQELENTDGGIVLSGTIFACYVVGGMIVGAGVGYGLAAIEGWFD